MLDTNRLKQFNKLIFRDQNAHPEYTRWLEGEEIGTYTDVSPGDLKDLIEENDTHEEEITTFLALGAEGVEDVYGVSWPCPTPHALPAPSLLIRRGDDEWGVYLFSEPVKEDALKHIKQAFNKDLYDLCDVPLPTYKDCKVKKTKAFRRHTPEELFPCVDLEAPLRISHGPKAAAVKGMWDTADLTVDGLIAQLLQHDEGRKDGTCILQGEVAGRVRMAKSVIRNSLISFDLDTGENEEQIKERLAEYGYAYVLYTTHSHMKDTTEIKREAFFKWLGEEDNTSLDQDSVVEYLSDVKGIKEELLESLTIVDKAHISEDGVKIIVKHAPIPKFRIVFFLTEPFEFQGEFSQKDRIDEWRERYHGLGSTLGFHYDQKTTDPSRLFYLPRHPEGNEDYSAEYVHGATVDLNDYPRLKIARHNRHNTKDKDPRAERKRYRVADTNLVSWARHNAPFFEIQTALEEYAPEDIFRDPRSNGAGIHVECPFEGEHSQSGGQGFFVIDATENDEFSEGFVAMCSHDACAGRDRLDFLKGMIDNEWLPSDILDEEGFFEGRTDAEEEDEEEPKKKKKKGKGKAVDNDSYTEDDDEEDMGDFDYRACYDDPLVKKHIKKMDKVYSIARMGTQPVIIKDRGKKEFPTFVTPNGWHILEAQKKLSIPTREGEFKLEKLTKLYMEAPGIVTYWDIVFEPGQKQPRRVYNLFDGFPLEPVRGDWSILQDHILNIWCDGDQKLYEWVITWLADIVQNPGDKKGSSIVLKGEKGTGKTTPLSYFAQVIGKYATTIANADHLIGKFNAHQKGTLLITCEEAVWGGDRKAQGVLQDLITGKNMMLEKKGYDAVPISNYSRFAFISNEAWVVPASFPEEERRFCILNVSSARRQDRRYFADMKKQMNEGGLEAMYYDLMTWVPPQEDGWECLRNPPLTEGLIEQAMHTAPDEELFFISMIDEGYLPYRNDDTGPAIYLDEDNPTPVPSEVLKYHYTKALDRSVQASARRAATNSKEFIRLVSKFLQQERNASGRWPKTSFQGTRFEFCTHVGQEEGTDMYKRAYTIFIPPLKVLRKHVNETFGIKLSGPEKNDE